MKKNNYFSEQDFMDFLSEHGLTPNNRPDKDTEEGYHQFTDPEHAEKQITFVSSTILIDEDEEEEKE